MLLYRVSKTLRTRVLVIRDKLNRDKVSSKMPKMLPAHEELCRSNFALVCGRLFKFKLTVASSISFQRGRLSQEEIYIKVS